MRLLKTAAILYVGTSLALLMTWFTFGPSVTLWPH